MTFAEVFRKAKDSFLGTVLGPHSVRSETDGSEIYRCVVARSGTQDYRASEIDPDCGSDETIRVYRPPEEVLSPEFLASLNGCTITDAHPAEFVDPSNYIWVNRGFVTDAARGPNDADGNVTVVASLHCKDASIIEKIHNGTREVSCGYLFQIYDEGGRPTMRELRANHIAIVAKARAGEICSIQDSAPEPEEKDGLAVFGNLLAEYHRENPLTAAAKVRSALDEIESKYSPEAIRIAREALSRYERKWAQDEESELLAPSHPDPDNEIQDREEENMAECNCETTNKAHLKSCPKFGISEEAKCTCDAGDDNMDLSVHHPKCPQFQAAAEDELPNEQFSDPRPPQQVGGPDVIPVTASGGEGNRNPVRDQAYAKNLMVLSNLRDLRPYVMKSGDRKAIKEFNDAVVRTKREVGIYESSHTTRARGVQRSAQDETARMKAAQAEIADSFDKAIKAARAVCMADTHGFSTEGRSKKGAALDAQPVEQDYETMVKRFHRR